MLKIALITGITGQDGSYLAELLLNKGYIVHGLKRRSSIYTSNRINHLLNNDNFHLQEGDLIDGGNIHSVIQKTTPNEIYNLAAQSHVKISFETPEYTANVDALGPLRILESVRSLNLINSCRIYQASTSELFGLVQETPQSETTPFYPRSPYGCAKLYAYWITKNYREAYGMYACNGILFNHESPIRGEDFITRKITKAVASIAFGHQFKLFLGNLNAQRDWGHAKDYVEAMWKVLQQSKPDDYVIATGKTTSVREFCKLAFREIGIDLEFKGENEKEIGFISRIDLSKFEEIIGLKPKFNVKDIIIEVDSKYYRPSEVELLIGDSTKANKELNWKPKYDLNQLVSEMVLSDINSLKREIKHEYL